MNANLLSANPRATSREADGSFALRTAADNLEFLDQCLLFDLHRASRRVTTLYNERLRPTGLTMVHFTLMRNIVAIAPAAITKVARTLLMDRTSVTRLVAPLVRKGFVEFVAGGDLRVKKLAVTPQGVRAIRRSEIAWRTAQEELHEAIGSKQWLAMRRALRATVKSVRASREERLNHPH